jgi:hypothetical protein
MTLTKLTDQRQLYEDYLNVTMFNLGMNNHRIYFSLVASVANSIHALHDWVFKLH